MTMVKIIWTRWLKLSDKIEKKIETLIDKKIETIFSQNQEN